MDSLINDPLEGVGWAGVVLFNESTNRIIDGHGRLEIAKGPVPVLIGSWTESQERKILATLDPISGLATVDEQKLSDLLTDVETGSPDVQELLDELSKLTDETLLPETKVPEPRIEVAEELQKKWQVEPGQVWQIGRHKIICGDATKRETYERLMGTEKATMCFTDPPWNVAIGGEGNPRHRQREGLENDNLSPEEFSNFLTQFATILPEFVIGDLYCVLGASEWPTLDLALRSAGFHWSATIIWVKDIFVLGRSKYHKRYEPLWYGWHSKGKSSYCGDRSQDDVWEIPRPRRSEEHPTMKPVELVERAIKNSSRRGDILLDPFGGSGTSLVSAERTGRVGRAIELEPKYCAVTLDRLVEMELESQIVL